MSDATGMASFDLSEVEALLWEDAEREMSEASAAVKAKYERRVHAILRAHDVSPEQAYWFQRDPLTEGVYRCLYRVASEATPPALPCE